MAPLAPTPLRHVLGHPLAQPELGVCLGQPHEPSIGGDAASVEGGFEGECGFGLKTHPGCGTIGHEGASFG